MLPARVLNYNLSSNITFWKGFSSPLSLKQFPFPVLYKTLPTRICKTIPNSRGHWAIGRFLVETWCAMQLKISTHSLNFHLSEILLFYFYPFTLLITDRTFITCSLRNFAHRLQTTSGLDFIVIWFTIVSPLSEGART